MAEITVIVGSGASFVAGFVAWYTLWRRKLGSSFEKVPVSAGRSAHVLGRGEVLGGEAP